mmetsp:Transcript_9800/g.23377  ORF Transcript_9800/g.23377 Transcript_9800/m.23377 type:complete len:248 (-) Transcript_9800:898-1641(-)
MLTWRENSYIYRAPIIQTSALPAASIKKLRISRAPVLLVLSLEIRLRLIPIAAATQKIHSNGANTSRHSRRSGTRRYRRCTCLILIATNASPSALLYLIAPLPSTLPSAATTAACSAAAVVAMAAPPARRRRLSLTACSLLLMALVWLTFLSVIASATTRRPSSPATWAAPSSTSRAWPSRLTTCASCSGCPSTHAGCCCTTSATPSSRRCSWRPSTCTIYWCRRASAARSPSGATTRSTTLTWKAA